MTAIFKGDDTNAFGQNFIQINLVNPGQFTISKVIFQCGPIQKVFIKPQFPIYVNFSTVESDRLQQVSECYLQIFDEKGLRQTCEGKLTFTAKAKVVNNERSNRY